MPMLTTLARPFAAVALLTAAGTITGCGEDKQAEQAVTTANQMFQTVASGDENAFMAEAVTTYNNIEGLVGEYAGDSTGYAEAAAVSLAQAKLGLASNAAQEAAAIEGQAIQHIRIIRANLSEYMVLSAIAEAASIYDPAEDIAALNTLVETRREDSARYTEQKAEIDNRIGDLDAKIAVLRARAIAERQKAGTIELSMINVSAQEAAELAADVREHTLSADQFDFEGDRIAGVVGQLRPTAAEIALNTQNAMDQITLLENSLDEVRERARASQQDAAQAREAATEARARIAKLGEEFRSFRSDEVSAKSNAVTRFIREAEQALRDANQALRVSASATKASAKAALGSAESSRATGHAEAAAIFRSLDEAGIPGGFGSDAETARNDYAESITASQEAFGAAANALRSMRVTGDARDRIDQAAARFDALAGIEPEPDFTQEPEEDFEEEVTDDPMDDEARDDEDMGEDDSIEEDDG
ncbi:MAG: hypothetical protein AB8F26_08600 [Phycisphaerales bacterium]